MDRPFPPTATRRRALQGRGLVAREPATVQLAVGCAAVAWWVMRGAHLVDVLRALTADALSAEPDPFALACLGAVAVRGALVELAGWVLAGALLAMVGQAVGAWSPAWRRTWTPTPFPWSPLDRWTVALATASVAAALVTAAGVAAAVRATSAELRASSDGRAPLDAEPWSWLSSSGPLLVLGPLCLAGLAVARWWATHHRFNARHGMTRAELLEEFRNEAGSPEIRRARRERLGSEAAARD